MNNLKELSFYYEKQGVPNFENDYYDFLLKTEENNGDCTSLKNVYIDPDNVTSVGKTGFYNHLTCFLNHQEKKYKNNYFFLPPKKALLTTLEEKEKCKDKMDNTKITVVQSDSGKALFRLTSDQLGFSASEEIYGNSNNSDKYPLVNLFHLSQKENQKRRGEIRELIVQYVKNTRTIGGSFLWPVPPKGGCNCFYNTIRGVSSYLEDRVDLTLLEIKHALDGSYDKGEHTSDILYRQYQNGKRYIKEWLKHFDSFDSYVEYFMLEDFVEKKDGKYVPINIINDEPLSDDYLKKYREQYKKFSLQNLTEKEIRVMLEYLEKKILERSARMENIIKLYYKENHG